MFQKLILAILLLFSSCVYTPDKPIVEPPIIDDTLVIEIPIDTLAVLPLGLDTTSLSSSFVVACTGGQEIIDHLDSVKVWIGDKDLPSIFRAFYLMSKDSPDDLFPYEHEFIPASEAKILAETDPAYNYKNGFHYYSNRDRYKQLKDKFDKVIVSTECQFGPDGIKYLFSNKNRPMEHWKYKKTVKQWVRTFIANMNDALGPGKWVWQFTSEPWDISFSPIMEIYMETWLEYPVHLRPQLCSPALPLGQGDTTEDGTNKWYDGQLIDFLPSNYTHFTWVAIHAYSIKNNKLTNNPQIAIDIIKKGEDFVREWDHLKHCKILVTEMGFSAEDQELQLKNNKTVIDYMKSSDLVAGGFIYNLRAIKTGGVFDTFFLVSEKTGPTLSYQLLN